MVGRGAVVIGKSKMGIKGRAVAADSDDCRAIDVWIIPPRSNKDAYICRHFIV